MRMSERTTPPQTIELSQGQITELTEYLQSTEIEGAFADAHRTNEVPTDTLAADAIRMHFLDSDGNLNLPETDAELEDTLRSFTRDVLSKATAPNAQATIGSFNMDDFATVRRSFDRIASDIYAITEIEPVNPVYVQEMAAPEYEDASPV